MPIAKGSKSLVIWKTEATWNTAPTTVGYNSIPFNSEGFGENVNAIQGEDLRADRANSSIRGGNIATNGALTHDFGPTRVITLIEHLLACTRASSTLTVSALAASTPYARGAYVLGATSHTWVCIRGGTTGAGVVQADLLAATAVGARTGIAADAGVTLIFEKVATSAVSMYEHALHSGSDMAAVGLAFEKQVKGGTVDLLLSFTGCRMNSLELTVPQEGIVKANWNILAMQSAKLTATNSTGNTTFSEDPFTGYNAFVHLNDSTMQARVARPHREFSATITNNIAEDAYVLNNRMRVDLPEGTRRATGRLSVYFEDATEYDLLKNETEAELALSLIHRGMTFIARFPEVKLTGDGVPKVSGAGIIQADFDWTAFKQDADHDVEVTIRNQTVAGSLPV